MTHAPGNDSIFLSIRDTIAQGDALASAVERVRRLHCWTGGVNISPLSGGLSNINLVASDSTGSFVVRYGAGNADFGISREREAACLRAAAACGVAPRVRYSDHEVIVMEMLDGAALLPEDLRDFATLREVAAALRRFHAAGTALDYSDASFWPFHHCRWVLRAVHEAAARADAGAKALAARLVDQVDAIEGFLGAMTIVFGHGDMVPQNIVRTPAGIKFVDLEYSGFAPDLFDLGGLGMNGQLEDEAIICLLGAYYGSDCSTALVARLHAMRLIAGIRELAWSMKSELKPVADFDYAAYSEMCRERLDRQSAVAARHGVPGLG